MRIWGLLMVAAVLALGLGAYRVVRLEQRIDALAKRLGEASAPGKDATVDHAVGVEPRLDKLEAALRQLESDVRELQEGEVAGATLPKAALGEPSADKKAAEDHILDVVGRAQNRIRDRQLQFHRDRWIENREAALDDFSQRFGLTSLQTQQLHQFLSIEVDGLIEILRRPDAAENPEKAARDWQAKLDETDQAAHRVLAGEQIAAWDQARFIERRTLWPWLPVK